MRTIEHTSQFKRDYRRESKGQYRHILETELKQIVAALAMDEPLNPRHHDHAMP